ncbi:hypothetical protein FG386_003671 [Cryptosporidium ryanae]|uniref:uncharacterized protein n=1 Tax=Cryptosporidium ryanae TaxID=515981 RepID=UPI00351A2A4C|nr:hypothetical protein FG386_003671 [Cryptosporidium ryanae]
MDKLALEADVWINNLESGVTSSIEMTKSRLRLSSEADWKEADSVINEYDNLYKSLSSLRDDTDDYYNYLIESLAASRDNNDKSYLLVYNKAVAVERLIQKITNSMEFIDSCISNEFKNESYIETLSIIWRRS